MIPYRGAARTARPSSVAAEQGGLVRQSFGQLSATLRDLRGYPMTLTFLVAYLFYNDGIQTVIALASRLRREAARVRDEPLLIATILLVQFVGVRRRAAVRPARPRGTAPRGRSWPAWCMWMVVVTVGCFMPPAEPVPLFLALAVGIGLVLGGTQALSRSFFSQLIPRGREAEYFSLYQACERGTSWLGTLVFGLVHQWTDSYRPAIFALIVFFVVGGVLLLAGRRRAGASRRPATSRPSVGLTRRHRSSV